MLDRFVNPSSANPTKWSNTLELKWKHRMNYFVSTEIIVPSALSAFNSFIAEVPII